MMRSFYSFGVVMCCFLGLFATVTGCGSGNIKAGGTVKYSDGSPLDRGIVVFETPQNQYTGIIQSDGTFRLSSFKPRDGLPPGTYGVSFRDVRGDDDAAILDVKFDAAATSGITIDVTDSSKPIDLVVERSTIKRLPPPPPTGER